MINKKTNRLLSSMLGAALIVGLIQAPAFATDNVQAQSSYTANSGLIGNNNSVEQNGVKITLNSVVGTKNKLKATITIQTPTPFDKNGRETAQVLLNYGDNKFNGGGTSFRHPDDKTLVVNIEYTFNKSVLPEKGPLRIDVVMQKYKVNVGLDVNVDFSDSLKNSMEKDYSVKIPQFDSTFNKLESDILGTHLSFTEPEETSLMRNNDVLTEHSFILKAGDKMYPLIDSDSYSSDSDQNNMSIVTTYDAEGATYEKIKDQTAISLIPISFTINSKDQKNLYKEEHNDKDMQTINNVSYAKTFDFSDGSKGEIYNIQRDDNSVKVYLKGVNEKESLLLASSLFMDYKHENSKKDYYDHDYYDGNERTTFYKDPNDSLGYIVEFSNVKKDVNTQIDYDPTISLINAYTVGDEIQLSK